MKAPLAKRPRRVDTSGTKNAEAGPAALDGGGGGGGAGGSSGACAGAAGAVALMTMAEAEAEASIAPSEWRVVEVCVKVGHKLFRLPLG